MSKSQLFIGLMSGTSVDCVDSVIVDLGERLTLICANSYPIESSLKRKINSLYDTPEISLQHLGNLNVELGKLFANATLELLSIAKIDAQDIIAIGSHGQTIFHSPDGENPFSMQLGDPTIISTKTKIATVADFRNKDIALGGQGAPLAPLFHNEFFRKEHVNRGVVNIGGIANITLLPSDVTLPISGFDTGPGNTLLDRFAMQQINKPFDENGEFAKSGQVIETLLTDMMTDDFFQRTPPKSTGREYFNLAWLRKQLSGNEKAQDVQRTLVELTVRCITQHTSNLDEIIVCGGGVHNRFLMQLLSESCQPTVVTSSQNYDINPDLVEAICFAWLAQKTINKQPVNLKSITGGAQSCILGGVYL